jgi:glycyl-tRNA synthetase beta chain
MKEFLLEIGTEEIPHWMIEKAVEHLSVEFQVLLDSNDIEGGNPFYEATPRRLVIMHHGLAERQLDSEVSRTGPPKSAGNAAAAGFAKKNGVTVEQLEVISTEKGEYFCFRERLVGRPTMQVLSEKKGLPDLILGIPWPKTMRWEKTGTRFIRPIRWIVALLGDEIIPFEIAGVKSGNLTRGHRVLGSGQIKVNYGSIEGELRSNKVILGALERRTKIETEAKTFGATLDPDLVETLTYITEYPAVIRGDFDPAYLALPAEVLTMVMRHHQKYFAVETSPGVLAPHFVAVMNIPEDPEGEVKKGNERVLKARFNDARFFWEVDQKKKLADRVEDLSHVTFQAKLGTYLEKTNRVVALVKELGGDENAQRAALLAKTDLTTEMVKEFTDLQGVVGGLYAKAQGEPEAVSKAIYEHYKPLSMEDSIPSTEDGQILAIADKLDNLREFFRIGMVPTGSKDPFALRRAAQGIVKILVESKLPFTLKSLIDDDFMRERIHYYFREIRGFKYDEVKAVMAVGITTLVDLEDRLKKIAEVRSTPDFEPLAASFKRINNILKQADFTPGPLQTDILEEGPERELYNAFWNQDFGGLEGIALLRPVVDRFFDKVMVNVPDEKIRANRLTLLHNLLLKFSTIADFSEIVTSGDQNEKIRL